MLRVQGVQPEVGVAAEEVQPVDEVGAGGEGGAGVGVEGVEVEVVEGFGEGGEEELWGWGWRVLGLRFFFFFNASFLNFWDRCRLMGEDKG